MIQEQCAFKRGAECTALLDTKCEDCPFYKTQFEFEVGLRKARKRIEGLNISQQIYIRRKYYGIDEDKLK